MPGGSVRVGGVHVDFSANTAAYVAGVRQSVSANRGLAASYGRVGFSAQKNSLLVGQFTSSIRSSLIATAAYAVGVGLVSRTVAGSVRAFLEFEKGLVIVQKTADLTSQETEKLGQNFNRLLAETSSLNRPLPVTRKALLEIADVAGQMNIKGVRNITNFTETVSLMGLTTDLEGKRAAEALGLIIENTTATVETVSNLGSSITALGNTFRGGEVGILEVAEEIARATARFRLSAQDVLGFSAALAQSGARTEKAGTVFQRALQELVNAANEAGEGNLTKLRAIVGALDGDIETLDERVEAFRQRITSGDFTSVFLDLVRALRSAGAGGSGDLLTTLFGGERPPTRLAEILGVLAARLNEVERGIAVANGEWERNIALLEEAGKFSEAAELRLLAVTNQIGIQAIAIGESITAVFLPIAENFKIIEAAAIGLGAAIAVHVGQRLVASSRLLREQERAAVGLLGSTSERNIGLRRDASTGLVAASLRGDSARIRAAERLGRATTRAASSSAALAAAELTVARNARLAGRAVGRLRSVVNFLGGPIGITIGLITAASVAFSIMSRRTSEAADRMERINELIKEVNRSNEEGGLTQTGVIVSLAEKNLIAIQEEVSNLRDELSKTPDSFENAFFAGSINASRLTVRLRELTKQADELEEIINKFGGNADDIGKDGSNSIDEIRRRFEALNLSLDLPVQKIRAFSEGIDDLRRASLERSMLEESIAGISPREQTFRRLVFAEEESIARKRLDLRRAVRDAIEDESKANDNLRLANEAQLRDTGNKEAASQLQRARRAADAASVSRKEREAENRAAEGLSVNLEKVRRSADQLRDTELARAKSRQVSAGFADIVGQQRAAEDELTSLRESNRLRDRQISQAREIEVAGFRGPEISARYEIENILVDKLTVAKRALFLAERERSDSLQLALDLERKYTEATDAQKESIIQAIDQERLRTLESVNSISEAKALIEELENLESAWGRVADSVAEAEAGQVTFLKRFLGPLQELRSETDDLATALGETAVDGAKAFGEELSKVVGEGKIDFRSLVESIIQDLIKVLIQTVIVNNAIKALSFGFGSFFGGGASAAPVSNFFGFAHDGGIAGNLPLRDSSPLRSNEMISVLEKGEEVIPRRDPRHRWNIGGQSISSLKGYVGRLPKFHSGGVAGGGGYGRGEEMKLNLELINQTSNEAEVVDNGQRFDMGRLIQSVIIRDASRNGAITQTLGRSIRRS